MRALMRNGAGAVLVVLIMFMGSLVLWVGTPLLWLWVGSQIQGATESLGTALGAMFVGVIITITASHRCWPSSVTSTAATASPGG